MAVGGYINGIKVTIKDIELYIRKMFRNEEHLAIPHMLLMQIALPDGKWYFAVNHYGGRVDEFDYYIPETREQEANLIHRFVKQEV
jgi:hypothetical protein